MTESESSTQDESNPTSPKTIKTIILGLVVIALIGGAVFVFFFSENSLQEKMTQDQKETNISEAIDSAFGASLLTVEDLMLVVPELGDLHAKFIDVKAEADPDDPRQQEVDAFYTIRIEHDTKGSVTLNFLSFAQAPQASAHYDNIKRQIPGLESMDPAIGELSETAAANNELQLGNIILVKKENIAFQLHTNWQDPLVTPEELLMVARIVEERM